MARTLPDFENECFFIAPIGAEGSPERKRSDGVLRFIVSQAAESLGLMAVRADQIAEPGQITLQVVEHVLNAKAAVVDLTGLNPNVFYELAIRHTARLPVALIVEKGSELPFDIAQMRTIFFDHKDLESADECRKQIEDHLREAIEGGSVDSPIATTVDVKALQSGSVVERNVAELVTSVEELTRLQKNHLINLGELSAQRIPQLAIIELVDYYADLRTLAKDLNNADLLAITKGLAYAVRDIALNGSIDSVRIFDSSTRAVERVARKIDYSDAQLRDFEVELQGEES